MSQVTIEPRRSAVSPALEKSNVIKGAGGRIFGLAVQLGDGVGGADTMTTGTYWLLLLDAKTAPSAGAVTPIAAVQVDHTAGTRDSLSFGDEVGGIEVQLGAVLLLSTSGPSTYAVPSGNWLFLSTASYT